MMKNRIHQQKHLRRTALGVALVFLIVVSLSPVVPALSHNDPVPGLIVEESSRPAMTLLDFPAADSRYHDYSEMVTEIQQAAVDHPDIFSLSSIGTSYERRTIWLGKISFMLTCIDGQRAGRRWS